MSTDRIDEMQLRSVQECTISSTEDGIVMLGSRIQIVAYTRSWRCAHRHSTKKRTISATTSDNMLLRWNARFEHF